MLVNIVTSMICSHFTNYVGKNQSAKPESERRGLLITFSLKIDYEREEGYRNLDLLIYAGSNYVSVFRRERWDVMVANGPFVGNSGWTRISHHDSCWREDGVNRTIFEYREKISMFGFSELKGHITRDLFIPNLEEIKQLGIDVNRKVW